MATRKKKTGRKQKPKSDPPPHLSDLIERLQDGIAHLRVAYQVIVNGSGGPESTVLLSGLQMIEGCEDHLERYNMYYNPRGRK